MFVECVSAGRIIFVLPSAQGSIDVLSAGRQAGKDVAHLSSA